MFCLTTPLENKAIDTEEWLICGGGWLEVSLYIVGAMSDNYGCLTWHSALLGQGSHIAWLTECQDNVTE